MDRLRTMLLALLPAPIASRLGHHIYSYETDSTTYLNGVRGVAAVTVMFQHISAQYYDLIYWAHGSREEDTAFIQLPFVRLLVSGQFAVHLFFVLSGFVLSHDPLRRAYEGQYDSVLISLPSKILRRPLRLFLPLWPVIVVCCVLIEAGWFPTPPTGNLWAQLVEGWRLYLFSAWAPFRFYRGGDTDVPVLVNWAHAWTLSAEFRGSMVVFFLCTMVRMSPWLRLIGLVTFSWYCLYESYWDISLFIAGMVLAEVRHLRARLAPLQSSATTVPWFFWAGILVSALYIAGFPPHDPRDSPWYGFLMYSPSLLEVRSFYLNCAAFAIILSLENLPRVQEWLNSRVILYLGHISFGLYLMHWPVVFSAGERTINHLHRDLGYTLFSSVIMGGTLAVVLSVWIGDVFTRLVDRNCIRVAKWVAKVTRV
ncbi:acyltransferase 3 [Coniella lustricola]|uniref:Acyltransferase 3 n=1 Tax=Coniella lustricola TaxID=2025994 RepID=A0A2T3ACD0_9PEZI|nr:acyltransferase 3 [Coniella lustricola]